MFVLDDDVSEEMAVPPTRRGSRDERRDETVRLLGSGQEARCAFCGTVLPPIPARGGRPTPYCPADPQRYGKWGAKVITCALLDECREIWVRIYGADQPMTPVDLRTLDERAATVLAAMDPLRDEVTALRARVTDEAAVALTAKADADRQRAEAETRAHTADADRARAVDEAEQSRAQARADQAERVAAQQVADQAVKDRDDALARQKAAEKDKDQATADRERVLTQLAAAHERIGEVQNSLASERASALEQLDQLRRDADLARHELRTALTAEFDERLRARTAEFEQHLTAVRTAADDRAADLTRQLTEATERYADTLRPLHDQLTTLRTHLTDQTTTSTALRGELDDLRAALKQALDQTGDDPLHTPLHGRIAAILDTQPPT